MGREKAVHGRQGQGSTNNIKCIENDKKGEADVSRQPSISENNGCKIIEIMEEEK